MLKILFNSKKAERHPLEMLIIGFFYSTISIFFGEWIFPEHTSLVMVFLTVISCLYIVQGAIRIEEEKEQDYKTEEWTLREHYKALSFLLFLFIGFTISFAFWTLVLPAERVSLIFSLQESVVNQVRAVSTTGNAVAYNDFIAIFFNNSKVLFIALIFAFFYGGGAIFILAWNASVMGFVIGTLAKETLGFAALPVAFVKYFLHGIPEMFAYIATALAGGIIYIAIIRGDFRRGKARRIITDTLVMVFLSLVLLALAALIEIYISPLI